MIETEKSVQIRTSIESVWDYVKDMERWADSFPGCRECTVIDENRSRWTIKVGVGGLVKTVNVKVNVDNWSGPDRVDFSYELEAEPVVGSGSYSAVSNGAATDIRLHVVVKGSGQMAPMWEAMCKPLLPELAQTFGDELKYEIETIAGVAGEKPPSLVVRFWRWLIAKLSGKLRRFWQILFGSNKAGNSDS